MFEAFIMNSSEVIASQNITLLFNFLVYCGQTDGRTDPKIYTALHTKVPMLYLKFEMFNINGFEVILSQKSVDGQTDGQGDYYRASAEAGP